MTRRTNVWGLMIVSLLAISLVFGCGGGGGSDPIINPPPDEPFVVRYVIPMIDQDRIPLPDGTRVTYVTQTRQSPPEALVSQGKISFEKEMVTPTAYQLTIGSPIGLFPPVELDLPATRQEEITSAPVMVQVRRDSQVHKMQSIETELGEFGVEITAWVNGIAVASNPQ